MSRPRESAQVNVLRTDEGRAMVELVLRGELGVAALHAPAGEMRELIALLTRACERAEELDLAAAMMARAGMS